MTAQPAQIDLADLGPGVAWAFEFDENGRGRLLEGNSSFDLTKGDVSYGCIDPRKRPDAGVDRRAGRASSRGPWVFLSKDRHPSLHWGGEALWGTLHDVRHEDQTAGMEATDLRFALWPQFLLTARHHAARSAMAVKDQAEKGATLRIAPRCLRAFSWPPQIRSARPRKRSAVSWTRSKTAFFGRFQGRKRGAVRLRRGFLARSAGSSRSRALTQLEQKDRPERASSAYHDRGSRVSASASTVFGRPPSAGQSRAFQERKESQRSPPATKSRPLSLSPWSRPCCCLRPS